MAWQGLFGWLDERSNVRDYNRTLDEELARQRQTAPAGLLGEIPQANTASFGSQLLPWQQGPAAQTGQGGPTEFSPEFFARAGGIPGYESLLAGMQQQQGAMSRQQQAQTWERDNMTLAQRGQLDEQRRQWENISPFQRAGLDLRENEVLNQLDAYRGEADYRNKALQQNMTIAQMNDARQREANAAARAQKAQSGLLGKVPEGMTIYNTENGPRLGYAPGAPGGAKILDNISQVIKGLSAVDTYKDFAGKNLVSAWGNETERGQAGQAWGDIIAAVGKGRDLGTMQASDIEFASKNLYNPAGFGAGGLPGTRKRAIGAVDQTRETLQGTLLQLAKQHPELYASPEAGAWRAYVENYQAQLAAKRKQPKK